MKSKIFLLFLTYLLFIFSFKLVSSLSINITRIYPHVISKNTNVSLSICFTETMYVDYLRGWLRTSNSCIDSNTYNLYVSSFSGIYCTPVTLFVKNCSSGMYYIYLDGYIEYLNYSKSFSFSYIYPLPIFNPPKIVLEYNYSSLSLGKVNRVDIKIKNYGDPVKDFRIIFNQSNCPVISSEIYLENLSEDYRNSIYFKTPLNVSFCTIPMILYYKDILDNSYSEMKIINLPIDPILSTININYEILTIRAGETGRIYLELYNPTNEIISNLVITLGSPNALPKKNYIYIERLDPYEKKRVELEIYVPTNIGGEIIIPLNISYVDSSGRINLLYNPITVKVLEKTELKFTISEMYDNKIGLDVINFGNSKINSLILKIDCSDCLLVPNTFYIGSLDIGDSYTVYFDVIKLNVDKIKLIAEYLTIYGNIIKSEYELTVPELNISRYPTTYGKENVNRTTRNISIRYSSILIYIVIGFILIFIAIGFLAWKIIKRFEKH